MAEILSLPEFITDMTPERIQAEMMDELPEDIDDMPGGFPWDFTMPTALELSKFATYNLARTLALMFPQYAWGDWLDLHGERVGIIRRAARKATGTLRITTNAAGIGLVIPAGTIFCTPATDNSDSILYETDEECIVETGEAYIPITAVTAGTVSNVMAGAVSLAFKPITNLTSIGNTAAITDGTDIEDDESYRERILEYYRSELSYVGCPADYVRWAKEISGVGSAICIPEWDGPGTVKLVITDSQGEPASESILEDVYDYIAKTVDSLERLAPIGATLTVVAPTPVTLDFSVYIKVDDDYSLAQVRTMIQSNLEAYYEEAIEDGEIKWADCFAIITDTDGVYDAKDFLLNGGTVNVSVAATMYPKTGTLTVTAYT